MEEHMLAPSGNRPSMLNVITSRRQFLIATAGVAAAVSLPMATLAAESERKFENLNQIKGKQCMNRITTENGTEIYFKDWGSGQPVVFSHGWPLSADAWEDQMFFLASRGFRCIAHDRRGHGRSSQPWHGNLCTTHKHQVNEDLLAFIQS
jgi:non-heme chloroperoxidase